MDRRTLMAVLSAALVTPLIATAQPAAKLPSVGILQAGTNASLQSVGAFEDQLRALGWIEGRTVLLERRYAEERYERYPELAAELVRLKVDVIVPAGGPPSLKAAIDATKTIPIVMVASSRDPVAEGLIKSLARPGGNITGIVTLPAEGGGKLLEILKEAVPTISRVGYVWDRTISPYRPSKQIDAAARSLGLELVALEVRGPTDFDPAIANAEKAHVGGLLVASTPMTGIYKNEIANVITTHRLPAIALFRSQAEAGLLITYGPSITDEFRRAAAFVDKILRGAKPGDIPVEQPTKFDLLINLKTAKAIGLTIPQSLLLRADEVIQ